MTTYKNMDEVLKIINKKYVSLETAEVKYNNERLRSTLWDLIAILKKQDKIFNKLFIRPYFGGSYYDDLRVGKPNEFDLDLLLDLPKICETHKTNSCGCVAVNPSNKPGFFWFHVKKGFCAHLDQFIKDGYMQTDLILNWMKSKVVIALNFLRNSDSNVYSCSVDIPTYFSESGPALTLQINGSFGHMDIDLVPAFIFGQQYWPTNGFRTNKTTKTEFFLVPKKPKGMQYSERYWRSSFQDQERMLIKGKERLKPSLRLLKKMRNNLVHSKISSYALKTIVLWDLETRDSYWNGSLGDSFMKLLEQYKECLENKRIPYYWNRNNNLLDGINPLTLENHSKELSVSIKKIKESFMRDPFIVAKVILKEGSREYQEFMIEFEQNRLGYIRDAPMVASDQRSTSYFTFDPSSSSLRNRNFDSACGTSTSNSRGNPQQVVNDSSSGWTTAGGILLGIGAVAAIGMGILGALSNNRNQNR